MYTESLHMTYGIIISYGYNENRLNFIIVSVKDTF